GHGGQADPGDDEFGVSHGSLLAGWAGSGSSALNYPYGAAGLASSMAQAPAGATCGTPHEPAAWVGPLGKEAPAGGSASRRPAPRHRPSPARLPTRQGFASAPRSQGV